MRGSIGGASLEEVLDRSLPAVREGATLVMLTTGGADAGSAARLLADRGLLGFDGMVGDAGPSWLGFWYFARPHPLLDGLPTGVLDWPYQITRGNGTRVRGPNVEIVVGYGRNHDPTLGAGAATVNCGKGQIVLLGLPGLAEAFVTGGGGHFQPVAAERILHNALRRHSPRPAGG